MNIKRICTISLSLILSLFYLNSANAQVYFDRYSSGHADISLWYKVGKFKIGFGPCFSTGREKEYIDIHIPIVKEEYSYEDVWIKHSPDSMKLTKGTIKIDTINRIIKVDLYEEKDGKTVPLIINGKHKLVVEELKNFRNGELFSDNCIFKNER